MRRVIERIKVCIFVTMLVLPGIIWYGVSILSPDTVKGWDYDTGEKREKAQMPDFQEENYARKLEEYYNDHIPFRSILISCEQRLVGNLESVYHDHVRGVLTDFLYGKGDDTSMDISGLLAKEEQKDQDGGEDRGDMEAGDNKTGEDDREAESEEHQYKREVTFAAECESEGMATYICEICGHSYTETIPALGHDRDVIRVQEASYTSYGYTELKCNRCGRVDWEDFEGKIIDNSYFAPVTVGDGVLLGRFDWLFYTGDNSISYYRGTNLLEEEKMAEYLELMQQLQDICDEREIQLQFMIIPNKEQIYPEYMPTYEIADTYKRVDRLVDYVHENSDINIIYPIQELKEVELYWQTYYKYDTHWNEAGAYIGTQVLYEALGMETTDLHDVEVEMKAMETGDLIVLGGLDASQYTADYDYVIDYKPEVAVTGTEGNKHLINIYYASANCDNDQKLVMLGDSFRCSMISYLEKDFSHCVLLHRDYVDSVQNEIRNADILVIAAVERYDSKIFKTVERLIEILSEGE